MRHIDLTGFQRAELRDQQPPMMIWARIDQLVIDERYQRGLTAKGRGAIQRMANAWDWRKFQPILVTPAEGGRFAVVDGQHRAHAAALVGLEEIPAMTVSMTLQEQAAGFAAVNRDRVTISLPQIYRAELAAGTPWALACRDAVQAAGCQLATYIPSSALRRPAVVYSVGLIRRMVEAGEGAAVTTGLAAIRESEQGEDVSAYEGAALCVWLAAIARDQRFMRLPLPGLFDSIDVHYRIEIGRIEARTHGGSPRAHATDAVTAHLRRALDLAA